MSIDLTFVTESGMTTIAVTVPGFDGEEVRRAWAVRHRCRLASLHRARRVGGSLDSLPAPDAPGASAVRRHQVG